jgi:Glycosyltransferase family 25 (LPS biosynthesis protein)
MNTPESINIDNDTYFNLKNCDCSLGHKYIENKYNIVQKLHQTIVNSDYKAQIANNIKNMHNLNNNFHQGTCYVGVISIVNEKSIIENIICNFKDQNYKNKKLFLITNTNNLPSKINNFFAEKNENDYYQLFRFGSNYSISYCMNYVVNKLQNKNCIMCAIFNNNCIYEPDYLTEQISILLDKNLVLAAKSNVVNFIPEKHIFINNNYDINSKLYYYGTCVFNINKFKLLNTAFPEIDDTEENIMYSIISQLKGNITTTSNHNFIGISYDAYSNISHNKNDYNYHQSSCPKLINHLFDKIYVINLEHDILMKNMFIDNNFRHNLNFTFWKGIYGKEDEQCLQLLENDKKKMELIKKRKINSKKRRVYTVGELGYIASTISIFNDAKCNNYKRIIIFDDDALLCNNFCKKFLQVYFKMQYDWNIIRLGSSWYYTTMNINYINTFNNGYFITKPTVGSFAVCYKNTCFDTIIEECEKYEATYDSGPLNVIKTKDYTLYPNLVIADLYRSTTSGISRNLYNCARLLGWNLSLFNFTNSMRKVSIVIVYDNNKNLIKTIELILQQSYKNIEIIIINNNSEEYYYNDLCEYLKQKSSKYENNTKNYVYSNIPVSFKNNLYLNTEYFVEIKVHSIEKHNDIKIINNIGRDKSSGCNIIYVDLNNLLNYVNPNSIIALNYLENEMNNFIKCLKK